MMMRMFSIAVTLLFFSLSPTCDASKQQIGALKDAQDSLASVTEWFSQLDFVGDESDGIRDRYLQSDPVTNPGAGRGGATQGAAETDDAAAEDETAATDDDDSTVLHDDAYYANKTSIIPPEPEQPSSWPATVVVIFLVLAAVLLGKTAYTNCRKRSQYEDVPTTTSLIV
ncbi:expressed unknown protein [Seminavis robusta]|uniref:Uncharacterized protein n=1 Tax=Seminavis robusta TaxID=568900 RepID=A0A9N8H6M5_9STRA|nr:expressed unknown protein [Seminavis robusta]|eukprot:Sro104_g052830.1 n/a (170) ;mRNA; r:58531-59040